MTTVASGPDQRAAERIPDGRWQPAGGKERGDQDRQPADAERQRHKPDGRQPFAQKQAAEDGGPDRHRIGDDDDAAGRAAKLREGREHLKQRHVEEAGHHDRQPLAARQAQVVAARPGGDEQDGAADAGAGEAQAPGRHLAQGDGGGDPVAAPGKGEQHDQQPGRAGDLVPAFRVEHSLAPRLASFSKVPAAAGAFDRAARQAIAARGGLARDSWDAVFRGDCHSGPRLKAANPESRMIRQTAALGSGSGPALRAAPQ